MTTKDERDKERTDNPIRKAVCKAAKKQELTAYAIAKRAGIPYSHIRGYLDGKNDITTVKLSTILEIVGLTITDK